MNMNGPTQSKRCIESFSLRSRLIGMKRGVFGIKRSHRVRHTILGMPYEYTPFECKRRQHLIAFL